MTDEIKASLLKDVVKEYAYKSFRTILVASTSYSKKEWSNMRSQNNQFESEEDRESVEAGLTLIGIFGL